uniref:Uncharacterized protein n=1 Tax=Brassica oleracea var. oleracea TaxID=109376 RepID=A0A0D3DNS4_BRAOL
MASFDEQENTRYVYGHHTTLKDLLGSSHIVDDMENPSRFSEEIMRCISSMYVTLWQSKNQFLSSGFTFIQNQI